MRTIKANLIPNFKCIIWQAVDQTTIYMRLRIVAHGKTNECVNKDNSTDGIDQSKVYSDIEALCWEGHHGHNQVSIFSSLSCIPITKYDRTRDSTDSSKINFKIDTDWFDSDVKDLRKVVGCRIRNVKDVKPKLSLMLISRYWHHLTGVNKTYFKFKRGTKNLNSVCWPSRVVRASSRRFWSEKRR